jgi:hypothetical protein
MKESERQETFYIVADISEPEDEKIELFTLEDAVAVCEQERQDNPLQSIEVREF